MYDVPIPSPRVGGKFIPPPLIHTINFKSSFSELISDLVMLSGRTIVGIVRL